MLAYLIAVVGMTVHFKFDRDDHHSDWRVLFQFSTVTWTLMLAYHVMVFSWTLTHLHWPEIEADDQTWESKLLRMMQPPQQTGYSRSRFYFSLFYSLVHVYSFMITIIFWTVLVPNGHGHLPKHPDDPATPPSYKDHFCKMLPTTAAARALCWRTDMGSAVDDLFLDGWFKPFCLFNIYTFPCILAFLEILFLNAIKRQVVSRQWEGRGEVRWTAC